jgi:phospholipase D1/2
MKENKERLIGDFTNLESSIRGKLAGQVHQYQDRYLAGHSRLPSQPSGGMDCQVVRSCTKWSGGVPTEHSIANAYIAAIQKSQYFVYIENQFFITATSDGQRPVKNLIGAAIVERILRAARAGEKYKVIVVIPSVPGFAGDLRNDSALGTRAIMEFQYNSINRGGHSIMELIAKEGYNPMEYIRFYNLRNYDRINVSRILAEIERQSGVAYEDARRGHEAIAIGGSGGYLPGETSSRGIDNKTSFREYQQAAQQVSAGVTSKKDRWDTVSECYMLGGEDIRNVPWDSDTPEIDAFVSEELYIHSKVSNQNLLVHPVED